MRGEAEEQMQSRSIAVGVEGEREGEINGGHFFIALFCRGVCLRACVREGVLCCLLWQRFSEECRTQIRREENETWKGKVWKM